eukprot:386019_1
MLSDRIEIHSSNSMAILPAHLTQITTELHSLNHIQSISESPSNRNHYNQCKYSLLPVLSLTKYFLNRLSNPNKSISMTHRRVLMGQHNDFQCSMSEAEQRKFHFGIKQFISFPCWIVTYFLPTSPTQCCFPKTSPYSRQKRDKVRRYCVDRILEQL